VQRVEVLRLLVQDFLVDALRGCNFSLPMQAQSLPEPGLQCHRSLIPYRNWVRDAKAGYFVSNAKAPFQSSGGGFF
jgi:hypothetical protein